MLNQLADTQQKHINQLYACNQGQSYSLDIQYWTTPTYLYVSRKKINRTSNLLKHNFTGISDPNK